MILLMELYLGTTGNPFLFQEGTFADHCIDVLNILFSIIETTTDLCVHAFYMHLKYSIDLTIGQFLRNNLIDVCLYLRILLYWYRTQIFCVKWEPQPQAL